MFWRIQEKWHEIHDHKSRDHGYMDGEIHSGICGCSSAEDLAELIRQWYSATPEEIHNLEVVTFHGEVLEDVGDGFVIDPTHEDGRMSAEEFVLTYMADSYIARNM